MKKSIDRLFIVAVCVFAYMVYTVQADLAHIAVYRSGLESMLQQAESELNYKARFPEVILAQSYHETDSLRSNIYRECKNLLGMKWTPNRSISVGVCRGHAGYASPVDSFKDYLLWQKRFLPWYEAKRLGHEVTTVEEYLGFLENQGYAEDPKYSRSVKKWLRRMALSKAL